MVSFSVRVRVMKLAILSYNCEATRQQRIIYLHHVFQSSACRLAAGGAASISARTAPIAARAITIAADTIRRRRSTTRADSRTRRAADSRT